jgi:hypothetical protein
VAGEVLRVTRPHGLATDASMVRASAPTYIVRMEISGGAMSGN